MTTPTLIKTAHPLLGESDAYRAHLRMDGLRSRTGRVATVAGAAAAAAVMVAPETLWPALLADAAVTGLGLLTLRFGQSAGHHRATASTLYLVPGGSLAALLIGEWMAAGIGWGEALALAVWSAGTWLLRPARVARRMFAPPPPASMGEAVLAPAAEVVYDHPAAQWWAERVATVGGAAPGTVLEDITSTGKSSMTAIVRSAIGGNPVPDVNVKKLSALMDIPEDMISVGPVPGRGTSVRKLIIGRGAAESTDPATIWTTKIAPKAVPGSVITSIETGGEGGAVVEIRLQVAEGDLLTYDLARLCSALSITDSTRLAIETDGGRNGMLTIYPSNPLIDVRAVTREDLVMDKHGRIKIGRYHNGRPVLKQMFDPKTGSAQRFVTWGTTGAGKSRAVQIDLIAEKINGIVSWVCDLKGGQSMPEAEGNVDWFGRTLEEAMMMLRAGLAVAKEREARYSKMGRTAFLLGSPDRLIHIRIAEINRLLSKGSPYRDEATHLCLELSRTGRSLGVGLGIDAQASHLEELGGSDTFRAMIKEGEIVLLRWSSSMMRQLVGDSILAAGEQLMPIPKTLTPRLISSQFSPYDEDADAAPATQGTAYLLSGPHPTSMMRHFRIGSIAPLTGPDPEILALYGNDEPARLEAASHTAAGEAYAARHDAEATAALVAAFEADPTIKAAPTSETTGTSGGRTGRTRLADRIVAVLAEADAPMDIGAVLDAVNADGGKTVSKGAVSTNLGVLANNGDIDRAEHGLYAPVR